MRISILLSAILIGFTTFGSSSAFATLCGTSITTSWSTSTSLGTGSVGTSESSFTAECNNTPTAAGTSVFSGTFADQPTSAEPLDSFSYQVFAIGDETLRIDISATDGVGNGQKAGFPQFTLDLTDISWIGDPGSITGVSVTDSNILMSPSVLTPDSIEISFAGGEPNCIPAGSAGDGCTRNFYAIFDLLVEHNGTIAVPEPASAGLFLIGLVGLGVLKRNSRKVISA